MIHRLSTIHLTMKKYLLPFLSIITILSVSIGCTNSSKLYQLNNRNRNKAGILSETSFTELHRFLNLVKSHSITDTLIIKYDYNHETCWNILDQGDDERIKSMITSGKQWMEKLATARQNVSFFHFRELGNDLNKIIKWDDSIIIDSSKLLLNLLFKQRSTCGTSIMVMPDKRLIYVRSDSHFEVFDLKQKDIEAILGRR